MITRLIVFAAVATSYIGGIITLHWWHHQEEDSMKRYQLDRRITPTASPETVDFLAWLFVRIMIAVGLIIPFIVWFCM